MKLFEKQSKVLNMRKRIGIIHKCRGGGSTVALCVRALHLAQHQNVEIIVPSLSVCEHYLDVTLALLKEDDDFSISRRNREITFNEWNTKIKFNLTQSTSSKIHIYTDMEFEQLLNSNIYFQRNHSYYFEIEDSLEEIDYVKFEIKDNPYLSKSFIEEYNSFKKQEDWYKRYFKGEKR